jgi:Spy/CpxP family protein refolding chaperone
MKYIVLTSVLLLGSLGLNMASAHGGSVRGGLGMIGSGGMMRRSLMGYNMTGYDMMMNDAGCPMMMGMGTSTDYLLSYKDDLALSKTQVAKLKKAREKYQKEAVSLYADLNLAMMELHNLLDEDELNILGIRAASKKIGEIESELRTKNIETYVTAKLVLTRDQLKKVMDMGLFGMQHIHGAQGMMR